MPKQILRIRDMGQEAFWQSIHEASTAESAQPDPQPNPPYSGNANLVLAGKQQAKAQDWRQCLEQHGFSVQSHSFEKPSLEELDAWGQQQTDATAVCVALGFQQVQLEVLNQATPGLWLNGGGPQADPCAALAEVALMNSYATEKGINLDCLRVTWLGKADGLAHSLMEAAIYAPFELFMALPPGGDPDHDLTALALKAGAKIFLTREPDLALDGAHLIYMNAKTRAANPPASFPGQPFSWAGGLCLSPELLHRAVPGAPVTRSTAEASPTLADDSLAEARGILQARMQNTLLKTMLSHTLSQ